MEAAKVRRVVTPVASPNPDIYTIPAKLYRDDPSRADLLTTGDREALSTMIAAFTFTPRTYDLMRFVSALNSTIQAYLVKKNRYDEYAPILQDISHRITVARILLASPQDQARAAALLYSLETALKMIAEREGLTQTGASMYDGRMPILPVDGHPEEEWSQS